jgi:hypothetical protein
MIEGTILLDDEDQVIQLEDSTLRRVAIVRLVSWARPAGSAGAWTGA